MDNRSDFFERYKKALWKSIGKTLIPIGCISIATFLVHHFSGINPLWILVSVIAIKIADMVGAKVAEDILGERATCKLPG